MNAPMMTLAQAQALLPSARLVGGNADAGNTIILRVHSDTRTVQKGDLFVALRGERFDAHQFLNQAANSGAVAVLAEHGVADCGLPGLEVIDSHQALSALATQWRMQFNLPLIAVTGSNGKTTVTQMLASILHAWVQEGAFATQGNFNNEIGVPLTLLRLRQQSGGLWHKAGVVELGMNHSGEIAHLAAMTAPTVALVNNAQREHQEFMHSVQAVADENAQVFTALAATGVAVFPADDVYAERWRLAAVPRRTLTFALQAPADITAQAHWHADHWQLRVYTPAGPCTVRLRIAGLHNVKNALAATACALAAGCSLAAIVQGLEAFQAVPGRSQLKVAQLHGQPMTLIDDTYNANPDSALAAIDVLAQLPGPRWLVLGDMGEVGSQGIAFHEEVGAYAQAQGLEALWTVGVLSTHAQAAFSGQSGRHFDTIDQLCAALPGAPASSCALIKGSRFMRMERVVQALLAPNLNESLQQQSKGSSYAV
jgi:UDP-N-acetylmuramoyl-tripeptide--D-alanyl-D-alanine ligase